MTPLEVAQEPWEQIPRYHIIATLLVSLALIGWGIYRVKTAKKNNR